MRVKLDIHHKDVPIHLEGFLADRFHFQSIKFCVSFTSRTVPTVNPSPMGNQIPMACHEFRHAVFQKKVDWSSMVPILIDVGESRIETLRNQINYKNLIGMGLEFVAASTGGMGPELSHKTLEYQFRFSLLNANDAFFIIEVLWVQIVHSVNVLKFK
ncbi:hypothetical protein AVEN_252500-1 [Araneus ventricosus]|uniref:Uncharacterized protein n=1 Tax=Araneus ventricosus TaxID=182803 RepID=A0A4Y2ASY3_ARAVE|nr:hypothetical protein AVEN_252500-1 [Araneus ventricosus]